MAAETEPGKDWREGPVRYLLSHDEFERYGKLRAADARMAFVARFWRRFDNDPDSEENEFKTRFFRLCELADQRFGVSGFAGWRTDRGRVLILLGEPDAVRRVAGDPVSAVREIWTYGRRPGGRGVPQEIVFYGDRSGRFRLEPQAGAETDGSVDPVDVLREYQRLRYQLQLSPNFALPRGLMSASATVYPFGQSATLVPFFRRETPLAFMPRPRSIPRGGVSESPASPFVSDAAYFFQAADGAIIAMLAVEYRPDRIPAAGAPLPAGEADCSAAAWVSEGAERMRGGLAAEFAVRLERRQELEREGNLFFTGRAYLEPGTYEARYVIEDRALKSVAVRNVVLTVPDFLTGELAASTVVPAERFGPVPQGARSPFAVGSEEVAPKPGGSFRRGEALRIYFQVYGAARDASSLRKRLDVDFIFEKVGSRRFRRHGEPMSVRGAAGESMGLTLPVQDWPPGDYRVEVDLIDRVSGAQTSTAGRFRIAD
jgi:GWxTD domain-containing protein